MNGNLQKTDISGQAGKEEPANKPEGEKTKKQEGKITEPLDGKR